MNIQRIRSRKGQSLVEFAIVLPVLLLLILIIVDFGRVAYYFTTIYNASREGARAGIVDKNITPAGLRTASLKLLVGVDESELDFTGTEVQKTTKPYYVKVVITYNFWPVTPLIGDMLGSGGKIPLRTSSRMNVEW